MVPTIIRNFPWPKSMRWGSGTLKWVRPLQSILCTFDGEVVPFEIEGIVSGNTTLGHRFLSSGKIEARRFEDYALALHKAHVIVDANARAETIRTEAKNLAFARGLEMIEDEALLKEVAGLVEWPVVLMGEFDKNFLNVPPEVIITTIKNNQKCFCLRAADGKLSHHYLLVANTVAADGGKTIIAGNNKVIAARLSDAKFFWDQDRKVKMEDFRKRLDGITFHAKLGTVGDRVEMIAAMAGHIGHDIGADEKIASLAGALSKSDLVTGMVGEFPELQGLMGYYYARAGNFDPAVAEAIRDQYKPVGPSDSVPNTKEAQALAIADKYYTLVRFWSINEKPTGSKDPFALRRAALGIIRIIIEGQLRVKLQVYCEILLMLVALSEFRKEFQSEKDSVARLAKLFRNSKLSEFISSEFESDERIKTEMGKVWTRQREMSVDIYHDLMSFFADRLKVYLKDQGARHDLIDAVFSLGGQDDLLMVVRRVEALSKFLETDDGKNLLAGVKRAANILRIEEKKDGKKYSGDVNQSQLIKGEEKALHSAISQASALARKAVEQEDFEAAMKAIAKLRAPIDEFFEGVTVNDKDATFRENRLRLLNRIREATAEVADFSKIEG
jgi:glycyl-tRNA synthetase beta chain